MQSDVLDIAAWEVMEEKKMKKLMMDSGDSSVIIVADQEVEEIIKTSENHESVELQASPVQICDNVVLRKLLMKKGVKSLLTVPISFVSEHIETLEEIDVEYKELTLESGIEKWSRVLALGCEPTFISDLADTVIESLPYVSAMVVSNLEARHSLVPLDSVEELLAAYNVESCLRRYWCYF